MPQDQAVAAVFIERYCTAYLPPIWGWATLVWMRRCDDRVSHGLGIAWRHRGVTEE